MPWCHQADITWLLLNFNGLWGRLSELLGEYQMHLETQPCLEFGFWSDKDVLEPGLEDITA